MRVAILGAGFAGLAVTWYLLHYTKGSATIDLYDPQPIGGGASGLSSGLLNPYTGKWARPAWEAQKGIKETHRLITEASRAIGQPILQSKGILRPAVTESQIKEFQKSAESYTDTVWWDKKKCEAAVEGLVLPSAGGGLFIKEGVTVNVQSYLQGLWQACALLGTQFHQTAMLKTSDLNKYDRVLVAMGPLSKNFPDLKNLPISPVKGQILHLRWPDRIKPLPFSLVSQKYLVMLPDQKSCLVGATYEHSFHSPHADAAIAAAEILPDIISFFPHLQGADVIHCAAAFRASTPSHLPIAGKATDKMYFLAGLGSKGLIYHALIGKYVARMLLTAEPKHLPQQIRYDLGT